VAQPNAAGGCPYGLDGAELPSVDGECPLVFDVSDEGAGLSETVVDAIVELVDGVRFEQVHGRAGDDPLDFVARISPHEVRQRSGEDAPEIADLLPDGKPDGEADSFVHVGSRGRLRFDVELRNARIAPLDVEQSFRVVVEIIGDGLILEQRTLRIRIPAGSGLLPETPDAGRDAAAEDGDAGTNGE
jgi:hypothetical protein